MADKVTNGAKAFGGLMVVVAILGGMAAIFRPMQGQIKTIQEVQSKAFDRWDSQKKVYDDWVGEHDRRIEARDAAQWERIKSLERVIFGQAYPVTQHPGEEP